jgi:multidrug efflux system outer membrane protein
MCGWYKPRLAFRLRPVKFARTPLASIMLFAGALLGGCTVGPNYKRPAATVPAQWDVAAPWRESAPKDSLPKGEWWDVFHDEELNAFEKQALAENQTIKVSIARPPGFRSQRSSPR